MSRRSRRGSNKRSSSFAFAQPQMALKPTGEDEYSSLKWDTLLPKPVGDDRVMSSVAIPETRVLPENFLYTDGKKPNISVLRGHLQHEGKLHADAIKRLMTEATDILKKESTLIVTKAPAIIVGDLHGQFYDLLTIFDVCLPQDEQNKFIFLGDYVDRGMFSTEIIFLLCACKINYPDRFFLLRGNHESRVMAESMTFTNEFLHKYPNKDLLELVYNFFDCLPLAVEVETVDLGNFLCSHGGFSPEMESLEEYNQIDRFVEPPTDGPLTDILWSDPVDELDDDETDDAYIQQWLDIEFVENTSRLTSYLYGAKSLIRFLTNNNLNCLVRAHQVMEDGYHLHYFMQDVDVPPCITIFSAPNYCDMYHNKGAFMRLLPDSICFEQYDAVDHPTYLPSLQDAFTFSLETLMDNMVEIVSELVLLTKYTADNAKDREEDIVLANKVKEMMKKTNEKTAQNKKLAQIRKEFMASKEKNDELFKKALEMDKMNDASPIKKIEIENQENATAGKKKKHRKRATTLANSNNPLKKEIMQEL